MKKLPYWVLTGSRPAIYDCESATAIEQTAKVYGAMNELIDEYNSFVDSVNSHIEEYETGMNQSFDVFKTSIRQEFQDFIDVIDLKITEFDSTIQTELTSLKQSIDDYLKQASQGLNNELATEVEKINQSIEDLRNELFEDINQKHIYYNVGVVSADEGFTFSIDRDFETLSNELAMYWFNTEIRLSGAIEENFALLKVDSVKVESPILYYYYTNSKYKCCIILDLSNNAYNFTLEEIKLNADEEQKYLHLEEIYYMSDGISTTFFLELISTKATALTSSEVMDLIPNGEQLVHGFYGTQSIHTIKYDATNKSFLQIKYHGVESYGSLTTKTFNKTASSLGFTSIDIRKL